MRVRREPWGTTRAGEPVELFTLERERLRARVATFGATLVALELLSIDGRSTPLVLGLDSLRAYDSPSNPWLGGVIGRCANRIASARFSLDGREHVLSANEGRHHLHGGRVGFDRRVWRVAAASGDAVELAYASRDGEEGYPGAVEVRASYALGASALVLRLAARASAATPLNLTQHSYFNLAGGGTILDHELEIRATRRVVVDPEMIPTGELASVADSAYDFRSVRRVGARLAELTGSRARGYDVCYALDRDAGEFAARLRDPASGRTLELATNQPGLQLYTGQHLRAQAGERGRALAPFAGLCLEAQGFPDAVHHGTFPSQIPAAGRALRERHDLALLQCRRRGLTLERCTPLGSRTSSAALRVGRASVAREHGIDLRVYRRMRKRDPRAGLVCRQRGVCAVHVVRRRCVGATDSGHC